ncbi:hypothetical protein [Streptomyces melanogenes]|uniref:hypothetical protein n=1 Tax=Streptomyces melanogenes TaxID=67326 RepID=UPI0037997CF6
MSIRIKAAGIAAAVIATVGIATAASASSDSGSPKPPPKPVKAAAAQAGTPVYGASVTVQGNRDHGIAYAECPAGTAPTGGGGVTSGYDIFFTDSYASGNAWYIRGTNTGSGSQSLTAFALCQ